MSQDRRYARGAEDMQEFIARVLEAQARLYPEQASLFHGLANVARAFEPDGVRGAMAQDDTWMRKVAGEDVPPLPRGPKRKARAG
jgi:hypothetical protein